MQCLKLELTGGGMLFTQTGLTGTLQQKHWLCSNTHHWDALLTANGRCVYQLSLLLTCVALRLQWTEPFHTEDRHQQPPHTHSYGSYETYDPACSSGYQLNYKAAQSSYSDYSIQRKIFPNKSINTCNPSAIFIQETRPLKWRLGWALRLTSISCASLDQSLIRADIASAIQAGSNERQRWEKDNDTRHPIPGPQCLTSQCFLDRPTDQRHLCTGQGLPHAPPPFLGDCSRALASSSWENRG